MASGTLGKAALTAATDNLLWTVPAATLASVNINVVNRDPINAITVNIAIGTSGAAGLADYIEFGAKLPPGGVLERTALALTAGDTVLINPSGSSCTGRVYGIAEPA